MSDELLARLALTDRNCACPGCKVRRDAAARIRALAARNAELERLSMAVLKIADRDQDAFNALRAVLYADREKGDVHE